MIYGIDLKLLIGLVLEWTWRVHLIYGIGFVHDTYGIGFVHVTYKPGEFIWFIDFGDTWSLSHCLFELGEFISLGYLFDYTRWFWNFDTWYWFLSLNTIWNLIAVPVIDYTLFIWNLMRSWIIICIDTVHMNKFVKNCYGNFSWKIEY